jgi:phospholipid transport system transporter-binding protein
VADAHPGARLQAQGSELRVSGELVLASVAQVLEPGRRAIAAVTGAHAVLDLSAVTRADSAALALVVDWMRAARARDVALALRAVPPQLAAIAQLSGLQALIPGAGGGAS